MHRVRKVTQIDASKHEWVKNRDPVNVKDETFQDVENPII